MSDPILDATLNIDPIADAEDFIRARALYDWGSPEEYDAISTVGLVFAQKRSATAKALLQERDDTNYGTTLVDYQRILTDLGFEKVFELPFVSHREENDILFIYAHRDGMLLRFDTYSNATVVNSASVYFNVIAVPDKNNRIRSPDHFSGGGCGLNGERDREYWDARQESDPILYAGDVDARVALRHQIAKLRENYTLVPRWVSVPLLWLLHYDDRNKHSDDYNTINKERIALLPDWVQEMITPAAS